MQVNEISVEIISIKQCGEACFYRDNVSVWVTQKLCCQQGTACFLVLIPPQTVSPARSGWELKSYPLLLF